MRAMPTANQATLNPNDLQGNLKGGAGYQKKQYAEVNQHYMHHNAVLPPEQSPARARPMAKEFKDPYANISIKPNSLKPHENNQLQMRVDA